METKYTEIFRLKEMLENADIKFEWSEKCYSYSPISGFEHYQIQIYGSINGVSKRVISVIQGSASYGSEENLLEIMGCLTPEEQEEDTVKGYLTAENVFNRIEKALKGVQNDRKEND